MDIDKKVRGNAISAYFMFFVSLSFLWSKNPYMNHPFVKSHVKTAFPLHILLLVMLFLMSYDIAGGISVFGFASLNDILTAVFGLFILAGILYGAYKAHMGETITLAEIFHTTGARKDLFQQQKVEALTEESTTFLILAHIPFFGFIISGQHPHLPHMRDIFMLHLLVMVVVTLLYSTGYASLANIILLVYIIWSIIQSLQLTFQGELLTLDTSFIPTPTEKYILLQSLWMYMFSTMHAKKDFRALQDIIQEKTLKRGQQQQEDTLLLLKLPPKNIPEFLYYIPGVNLIGLFFLNSPERRHIETGIILTCLFILSLLVLGFQSPFLLFFLFPVFSGIGKLREKGYKMPFIYDIFSFFASVFQKLSHLFHRTRELQKKEVKETRIVGETKKEA